MITIFTTCVDGKSLHANFAFVGVLCLDFVPLRR